MEFQLGSETIGMEPLNPIKPNHKDAAFYGANWVHLYTWWCDTQFGLPLPRPGSIYLDADLKVRNQLFVDYTMFGYNMQSATRQHWKDLFKKTGLNGRKAVQQALDKMFPPQTFPIPYDKLIDPNATAESRKLYAMQVYLRWVFYLTIPQGGAPYPAPFVLQVPIGVHFHTETFATCKDEPLDANYGFLDHVTMRLKPNELLRKVAREHNKELREWNKLMADPKDSPDHRDEDR